MQLQQWKQEQQQEQEQDNRSWMRLAVDAISRTFIIISHAALDEQSQQGHSPAASSSWAWCRIKNINLSAATEKGKGQGK